MRRLTKAFVILASLLCASVAVTAQEPSAPVARSGDAAEYEAVVKKDEARFTMPVPERARWRWHMKETRQGSREYAFDVKVDNQGQVYRLGLFLWKSPNSSEGSGDISSLLDAGQKNLFARTGAGLNTVVRDVPVGVRYHGGHLVITLKGREYVERLFSGRPSEVTFETVVPGVPPTTQTIPVVYKN
jgi:hypothetical protein